MDMLYAPWRTEYTSDTHEGKNEGAGQHQCVFCAQLSSGQDEKYGILRRFNYTVALLNKYPYNAGHILLLPIAHVDALDKLTVQARSELMELVSASVSCVRAALKSDGVNVGINIGKAAGAGIPSHLHVHVLPRWTGDTNFMPAIGQTKVVSFDLNKTYAMLHQTFGELSL